MKTRRTVRYAVVGLGYIAQSAVLPAFRHAKSNSQLAALVSGDPDKLAELGRKYGVKALYTYDRYDDCLSSGKIDAVYIALPNSLHAEYAVRAAQAGVHVLCEKPMAVTEEDCERMIAAASEGNVRLMIAYRLHFERANLKAIELVKSGALGEVKIFHSVFSMQAKDGNFRLKKDLGGGTLYDIGVYCLNAARNLFQAEPEKVFAVSESSGDRRFREIDETTSCLLHFPKGRVASFTSSFNAADASYYEIVGTKGTLRVDPAYEIADTLKHVLRIDGRESRESFSKRDQFAPELVYFSDCLLDWKDPEPGGREGLADVRVIRALYQSAKTGSPVLLEPFSKKERPGMVQEKHRAPVPKQDLIHAEPPSA